MRRPTRIALLVAALAAWAGCVTPSIPIPPPSPEAMTFELGVEPGVAVFSYEADDNYADAIVYIFNRTEGTGVITTADQDGAVAPTTVTADLGHEIAITFETDEALASTCVVLYDTGPRAECN